MKSTRLQKLHQQVRKAEMEIEAIQNSVAALFFLDGKTLPEIASMNGITLTETCDILAQAHYDGKIGNSLVHWIEKNINAKSLFKGVEYFTRIEGATVKQGSGILGLDENTMLFCEIYASYTRGA